MKFSILSPKKPTAPLNIENDTLAPAAISFSQHTSALRRTPTGGTTQIEKEKTLLRASFRLSSQHEDEKGSAVTAPLEGVEASHKLSDEPEYPSGAKLGIIVASLSLSVFLMALVGSLNASSAGKIVTMIQDNTIIATAIPKITDHFEALDDVGWYGSGSPISKYLILC